MDTTAKLTRFEIPSTADSKTLTKSESIFNHTPIVYRSLAQYVPAESDMKKTFTFLSGHWSTKVSSENDSSSSGRNQSKYLKRREQVRNAQRTHRERRDQYFKSLESEVLHLRANEANFLETIQELNAHISRLEDTLRCNGIQSPIIHDFSVVESPTAAVGPSFEGSFFGSQISGPNAGLRAQHLDALTGINDKRDFPKQATSGYGGPNNQTFDDVAQSRPTNYSHIMHTERATSYNDKSVIAHGMEFVLTLESPCLGHIDTDLTRSEEPSGHVLTASMPLLHVCQYPESFTDDSPSLDASRAIFERLTALSSELVLDDEYSPIQAWNYIIKQPLAYKLDKTQLQRLAQNMLHYIKCYGFGAVVPRDICVSMVAQILAKI